jgi:GTP cyclohydrolase I
MMSEFTQTRHTTIESAVYQLLMAIGEDPGREGLIETPARVAKAYDKFFGGYVQDPKEILGMTFSDDPHKEIVIVRNIQFYSHCEHHMVPFFGKAHVAYIPDGKIVGISKLARLVECFARRLQVQERLTSQVADTIDEVLAPLGVMVVMEAEHMCMTSRGIEKSGTTTVTSAVRGVFKEKPEARAEALSLIKA